MVGHPVLLVEPETRKCALWFGGVFDRDGRPVTQVVRVGAVAADPACLAVAPNAKAEQMIRKGSARAGGRAFDLEAVPRETFAPLTDACETQTADARHPTSSAVSRLPILTAWNRHPADASASRTRMMPPGSSALTAAASSAS